jgi:hypothetical protein
MTRIHTTAGGNSKFSFKNTKLSVEKLVFLKENFEFPSAVVYILVIFRYVAADIILYSKSLGSAETVKIWPRTSSQCGTPAGISSLPRAHVWTIASKPGVVFVQHYLSHYATRFHKFSFEKNGKTSTTKFQGFVRISSVS